MRFNHIKITVVYLNENFTCGPVKMKLEYENSDSHP